MDFKKEESTAYEAYFLLAREDTSKVKNTLLKNGAKILREEPLEKIRLAYSIKKQALAYAGSITFEIDPGILGGLGADLKLEKEIFRSLVTRLDLRKDSKEIKGSWVEASQKRRSFPVREKNKPESTSLTNEALEKKIEEILK